MLPNPNQWQYDTTYNELGQNWKDFPPTKKHFQNANDNFLNFNNMDYNMFVSTNKHAMDPRYRDTFRQPLDMKDYYQYIPLYKHFLIFSFFHQLKQMLKLEIY